jgi:hypothetical protein
VFRSIWAKKKIVPAAVDEKTNPRIAPMINPNTVPVVAIGPMPCNMMSMLEEIPKMLDQDPLNTAPTIPPYKVPKNIESIAIIWTIAITNLRKEVILI